MVEWLALKFPELKKDVILRQKTMNTQNKDDRPDIRMIRTADGCYQTEPEVTFDK